LKFFAALKSPDGQSCGSDRDLRPTALDMATAVVRHGRESRAKYLDAFGLRRII
jgi:hypothetical protein